jgi:peptidoglycan/LPS O-acetylase OafA/YrhL
LYPSYWVAVAFIVIIQYFIGQKITLTDIALHLTGFHYFFGYDTLGRHLWFVSVIISCYFLFWPSLLFVRQKPITFLSLLIFGFILITLLLNGTTRNIYQQTSSVPILRFFYHYIVFVAGILIANKNAHFMTTKRYNQVFLAIVLLVALIPYEIAKNNASWDLFAIPLAVFIAGIFCMLVISIFRYVKGWGLLFCLSSITYEIYLIHYSCINLSGYLFTGLMAYVSSFVGTIIVAFFIRYIVVLTRFQHIRN